MALTESDTRAQYIDPALANSGWEGHLVRREFQITAGRIIGVGKRAEPSIADYLLEYKGKRLAVIEAKKWDLPHSEGVSQAVRDGNKLRLPFAFATNGQKIRQINLVTGKEEDIDAFPTPDELWALINEPKNELIDEFRAVDFESRGGTEPVRYYQQKAVENVLEGIAKGDNRLLLTLATGTGKTKIAFHIAWKLFQTRWNLQGDKKRRPRILFLADRNILANQAFNEFSPFPEDALVRIKPDEVRKKGKVPTNGNIFFTIFQTFETESTGAPNFGEYPQDFFDLIIVDECHRGGATEDGDWRAILDYFSPAVQLGLTATPKRRDNVDTYAYFGEPRYIYSLKEGIGDGYLTPFRVRKYQTTIDDYTYTADDTVIEGDVEVGKLYTGGDFNRVIIIREREVYCVELLLAQINPNEKTIIFCATQAHALMIRDIINEKKTNTNTDYCVRVTADEGSIGDTHLRNFQDNEKTIPTILTTSQKLSTGVDARNIRNIVLMRPVNSIIEFKQIIGRGTRLYDGKDFFTIHDFVNASQNFYDPEWDGEPVDPEPKTTSGGGETDGPEKGPIDPPVVKREKVIIKLADGKDREFQHMTSKMFYSVDGTPMSLTEFIQSLFNTLEMPDLFKNEDELRAIWSVPSTRANLLKQLESAGFPTSELVSIQELIDAQNSDLFDVLEFVKYALKPVSREARAKKSRSIMEAGIEAKQLEFVDFLVSQYVESGVEELEESKLETLLEIKYSDVFEGIKTIGNGEVSKVRNLFLTFQKNLYLPNKEYSVS
ncbi:HsdR Type I site-specific restriction-modification system, R (restriction) subunit and related helicases [Candidatus Nanopelagicaceae bacterium]